MSMPLSQIGRLVMLLRYEIASQVSVGSFANQSFAIVRKEDDYNTILIWWRPADRFPARVHWFVTL